MVEALFLGAVAALGGRTDAAARRAYAELDAAYDQAHRAYHDLRHVESTLNAYLFLADDLGTETGARVVLALVYHDAVYEPRAGDNEERSAAFARRALGTVGIEESDLLEIERLILLTQRHAADDPVGALVIDADLAVLQGTPEEYDAYAAAIRREYAFVPEAAYREGRVRVLEGLLGRRLFTSPLLDEDAARANMTREIVGLKA